MKQQGWLFFGWLVLAVACGDSKPDASAAGGFCNDWGAAQCRKIYACAEGGDPEGFEGVPEGDCAKGFASLCSEPPSAGQTPDLNCAGKTPNAALASTCLDRLRGLSCAEFNSPTYMDSCAAVCGGGNGGGGSGGAPGTGGVVGSASGGVVGNASGGVNASGGATTITVSTALDACIVENNLICGHAFRCLTEAERQQQGITGATVAECESTYASRCAVNAPKCMNFKAADANICIASLQSLSCLQFLTQAPSTACLTMCQ